jgi:hypothetical protein
VVDVYDRGALDDGVGNVHTGDVIVADAIVGNKYFARAEGKPGDASAGSEGNRKVKAGPAANPGDQRGTIGGTRHDGAGDPTPAISILHPAAVMEWSEAPGHIVHPRPTPGKYPNPVAEAIGSPIGLHGARIPDGAVFRGAIPIAIAIEVFVAGDFR